MRLLHIFAALALLSVSLPALAQSAGSGPRRIQDGETLQGTLAGSDPTLGDGSHYDLYAYSGSPGETVVFTMRSADFDAYLAVGQIQGNDISADETDDDSAGGTDAEITVVLGPSGQIGVRANSLSAGQTGRYTLQAASLGGGSGRGSAGGNGRGNGGAGGSVVHAGDTVRGDPRPERPNARRRLVLRRLHLLRRRWRPPHGHDALVHLRQLPPGRHGAGQRPHCRGVGRRLGRRERRAARDDGRLLGHVHDPRQLVRRRRHGRLHDYAPAHRRWLPRRRDADPRRADGPRHARGVRPGTRRRLALRPLRLRGAAPTSRSRSSSPRPTSTPTSAAGRAPTRP